MLAPLVSVLMTAYNREKFISEAIESVLASTFKNFELIVVDDCSKDKTVEIARLYEKNDSRIRVYINDKNLGDYPNRNKAASYARGKYLKYLDSDDIMSYDCLEVMVNEMEAHPECAFGVSSRINQFTMLHNSEAAYHIHFFERGILDLSPSISIIRKDVFNNENGFLELRCVSDFEFWLRLSLKYPMLEMKSNLVFWREHESQEIRLGNEEYIKYSLGILNDKLPQSKLSNSEKKVIIKKYKKMTMRHLIKNIRSLGFPKFFSLKSINNLKLLDAL